MYIFFWLSLKLFKVLSDSKTTSCTNVHRNIFVTYYTQQHSTFGCDRDVAESAATGRIGQDFALGTLWVEVGAVPLDGHSGKDIVSDLAGKLVADVVRTLPVGSHFMEKPVVHTVGLDAATTAGIAVRKRYDELRWDLIREGVIKDGFDHIRY